MGSRPLGAGGRSRRSLCCWLCCSRGRLLRRCGRCLRHCALFREARAEGHARDVEAEVVQRHLPEADQHLHYALVHLLLRIRREALHPERAVLHGMLHELSRRPLLLRLAEDAEDAFLQGHLPARGGVQHLVRLHAAGDLVAQAADLLRQPYVHHDAHRERDDVLVELPDLPRIEVVDAQLMEVGGQRIHARRPVLEAARREALHEVRVEVDVAVAEGVERARLPEEPHLLAQDLALQARHRRDDRALHEPHDAHVELPAHGLRQGVVGEHGRRHQEVDVLLHVRFGHKGTRVGGIFHAPSDEGVPAYLEG
mmetsp:Transcript_18717/g.50799  ORF Transcript_18717/g.50799 Transcript_18717/m.50799 type:complete len:311 (-) Transcript_18717:55-987(-)